MWLAGALPALDKSPDRISLDGRQPLSGLVIFDGTPLRNQLSQVSSFRVFTEYAARRDYALRLR